MTKIAQLIIADYEGITCFGWKYNWQFKKSHDMQLQLIQRAAVIDERPGKPSTTTKILIVDAHPLFREGLKLTLKMVHNLEVIGEASTAAEAIYTLNVERPDLVIIDIALSGCMSGIGLVRSINTSYSGVKMLVLSMYDEACYAEWSLRAGVRGYITKDTASKDIISAVNAIINDEFYLSGALSRKLIDRFVHGSSLPAGILQEKLSNREFKIFRLIGNGFNTVEMAKLLNLSTGTVDVHKKNIRDKMNFDSSSDLLKCAIQWVSSQNR
ncbi:MAG TPA: response regulator transcription factor [Spirochaetota bacterium]|nr:response regulator transcription factor [Spirochaetota bacterium]